MCLACYYYLAYDKYNNTFLFHISPRHQYHPEGWGSERSYWSMAFFEVYFLIVVLPLYNQKEYGLLYFWLMDRLPLPKALLLLVRSSFSQLYVEECCQLSLICLLLPGTENTNKYKLTFFSFLSPFSLSLIISLSH